MVRILLKIFLFAGAFFGAVGFVGSLVYDKYDSMTPGQLFVSVFFTWALVVMYKKKGYPFDKDTN